MLEEEVESLIKELLGDDLSPAEMATKTFLDACRFLNVGREDFENEVLKHIIALGKMKMQDAELVPDEDGDMPNGISWVVGDMMGSTANITITFHELEMPDKLN